MSAQQEIILINQHADAIAETATDVFMELHAGSLVEIDEADIAGLNRVDTILREQFNALDLDPGDEAWGIMRTGLIVGMLTVGRLAEWPEVKDQIETEA